jgi:hypothetical protein
VFICLVIVAFAGLVYFIGATYSRRTFRRYLKEFFRTHPWDFQKNMALTQDIGLWLGIRQTPDMTVEDYVRAVRRALDLPPEPEKGGGGGGTVRGGDQGRRLRDDVQALPGR